MVSVAPALLLSPVRKRLGYFVGVLCTLVLLIERAEAAGPNPFLFVTQVPAPNEVNDNVVTNVYLGVGAGFGNHLGGTRYAPRGGDLWLAKPNGNLTNVT